MVVRSLVTCVVKRCRQRLMTLHSFVKMIRRTWWRTPLMQRIHFSHSRSLASMTRKSSPWIDRFGKWTMGKVVLGLAGSGTIATGAISLYMWYHPSPHVVQKENEDASHKYALDRKVKAITDYLENNAVRAEPSSTGIPSMTEHLAAFGAELLTSSIQSLVSIEGAPGTVKSTFIAQLLKTENAKEKPTPVAHLELRRYDFKDHRPGGCSISDYLCYQLLLVVEILLGRRVEWAGG